MNLSFCDSSGTKVLNHQNPNYFLSVFFQQRVVFNWLQPIFRFLPISFFLCCDFNWFRDDQLQHNSQIIKTPFAHFLTLSLSLPSPFVSPLFLFLSRNSSLTLSVSFPLSHHLSLFFPLSLSLSLSVHSAQKIGTSYVSEKRYEFLSFSFFAEFFFLLFLLAGGGRRDDADILNLFPTRLETFSKVWKINRLVRTFAPSEKTSEEFINKNLTRRQKILQKNINFLILHFLPEK